MSTENKPINSEDLVAIDGACEWFAKLLMLNVDRSGFSVSEVARRIGRSPSYLHRRFRGEVEISLYDAALILEVSGINASALSGIWGFAYRHAREERLG